MHAPSVRGTNAENRPVFEHSLRDDDAARDPKFRREAGEDGRPFET